MKAPLIACAVFSAASTAWGVSMTFENTTPISIPSSGTEGIANPYPTSIDVSGLSNVTDVNVSILGLSHTWPDDIHVVLEGPTGASLYLMSDVGGGDDVSGIDVTFDDEAAGAIPDPGPLSTGSYQVSQSGLAETFPAPAPSPGFGGDLSLFDGLDPNGTWKLWVLDDAGADSGAAIDGWSITFEADSTSVPAGGSSLILLGTGLLGLFAGGKKLRIGR